MTFSYSQWFETVFHWITTWDGGKAASQVTTKEWFEWANAQQLGMGAGSWGNSAHGWVSAIVYPSGHKVDGSVSGESWISLQDNNVGHQPETSPTWWQLIASPDIGADSALFTSVVGTTKLAGWDHVHTGKLSGHLFAQAAGVGTLVYSTPFNEWGHFVGKSDGVGEPAVRMSLTEDTCYTLSSEGDPEGGAYVSFYKVVSGVKSLLSTQFVADWPTSGFYVRFYVRRYTLGVDCITIGIRTNPAYIEADPLKWQPSYTTLAEFTDSVNPIPLSGHEYVGYRIDDGTGYPLVTHEAFGGSFITTPPTTTLEGSPITMATLDGSPVTTTPLGG